MRSILHILLLLVTTGFCTASPAQQPKTPRPTEREVPPANEDRGSGRTLDRSAGNPEGLRHPGNAAFPDTAFDVLLLDPAQHARIQAMEERYAERMAIMGPVPPTDPVYQRLWKQREEEIATILTPLQFERWKELNEPPTSPPAPMTIVPPQGQVTPMPIQPYDTLKDPMPVLPDTIGPQ